MSMDASLLRLNRWIEVTAAGFLAVVTLLTLAAVVIRYAFNGSLPDAFDLACLAQGITILWGMALATYEGRHITVDIVFEQLGAAWQRRIDIAATFISLVFLALVAWMSIGRALESQVSGLSTNELRIPVWPFWLLAALGLAASVLMAAMRLHVLAKDRDQ